MPDLYTEYQNLNSAAPLDGSHGYIEPSVPATGMSYRKRILRQAIPTNTVSQTLSGIWEVMIYSALGGTLLFHQIVNFRLFCVFDWFGGVTFYPLDSGAQFQTKVVNGQQVPQDAEGHYEGWRFVDTSNPTVNSEIAIPIFRPNSGAVLGSLFVDIDWQGPRYAMDLPPGAVFFVETDTWKNGVNIPVSFFQLSIEPGVVPGDAIRDPRVGETFALHTADNAVRCATWARVENYAAGPEDPPVAVGGTGVIKTFRHQATLYCILSLGGNIHVVPSYDEGASWAGETMSLIADVKHLASVLNPRTGTLHIYGEATAADGSISSGDVVMVTLARKPGVSMWVQQSKVQVTGDIPPKTGIVGMEIYNTTLTLIAQGGGLVEVQQLSEHTSRLIYTKAPQDYSLALKATGTSQTFSFDPTTPNEIIGGGIGELTAYQQAVMVTGTLATSYNVATSRTLFSGVLTIQFPLDDAPALELISSQNKNLVRVFRSTNEGGSWKEALLAES